MLRNSKNSRQRDLQKIISRNDFTKNRIWKLINNKRQQNTSQTISTTKSTTNKNKNTTRRIIKNKQKIWNNNRIIKINFRRER